MLITGYSRVFAGGGGATNLALETEDLDNTSFWRVESGNTPVDQLDGWFRVVGLNNEGFFYDTIQAAQTFSPTPGDDLTFSVHFRLTGTAEEWVQALLEFRTLGGTDETGSVQVNIDTGVESASNDPSGAWSHGFVDEGGGVFRLWVRCNNLSAGTTRVRCHIAGSVATDRDIDVQKPMLNEGALASYVAG